MVALQGIIPAPSNGAWDDQRFTQAPNTREAAVGWLLVAAGGAASRGDSALAEAMLEEGYDTWASFGLSYEELLAMGWKRGSARAFTLECKKMRDARGIEDWPASIDSRYTMEPLEVRIDEAPTMAMASVAAATALEEKSKKDKAAALREAKLAAKTGLTMHPPALPGVEAETTKRFGEPVKTAQAAPAVKTPGDSLTAVSPFRLSIGN